MAFTVPKRKNWLAHLDNVEAKNLNVELKNGVIICDVKKSLNYNTLKELNFAGTKFRDFRRFKVFR